VPVWGPLDPRSGGDSVSPGLSAAAEQTGCVKIKLGGELPSLGDVRRCPAELSSCQYGDLSVPVTEVRADLSRLSPTAEQSGCGKMMWTRTWRRVTMWASRAMLMLVSPSSCSECRRSKSGRDFGR
jgi:hypothetical protein